jgi:hypothetical protein
MNPLPPRPFFVTSFAICIEGIEKANFHFLNQFQANQANLAKNKNFITWLGPSRKAKVVVAVALYLPDGPHVNVFEQEVTCSNVAMDNNAFGISKFTWTGPGCRFRAGAVYHHRAVAWMLSELRLSRKSVKPNPHFLPPLPPAPEARDIEMQILIHPRIVNTDELSDLSSTPLPPFPVQVPVPPSIQSTVSSSRDEHKSDSLLTVPSAHPASYSPALSLHSVLSFHSAPVLNGSISRSLPRARSAGNPAILPLSAVSSLSAPSSLHSASSQVPVLVAPPVHLIVPAAPPAHPVPAALGVFLGLSSSSSSGSASSVSISSSSDSSSSSSSSSSSTNVSSVFGSSSTPYVFDLAAKRIWFDPLRWTDPHSSPNCYPDSVTVPTYSRSEPQQHRPQVKLLYADVWFLSTIRPKTVLVIGCSPGLHYSKIPALHGIVVHFVDPLPHKINLQENWHYHQDLTTLPVLQHPLAVITDFRSRSHSKSHEANVHTDCLLNNQYILQFRPDWYSLKFRVPSTTKTTYWPSGIVFRQPFGGEANSEFRLFGCDYQKTFSFDLAQVRSWMFDSLIFREEHGFDQKLCKAIDYMCFMIDEEDKFYLSRTDKRPVIYLDAAVQPQYQAHLTEYCAAFGYNLSFSKRPGLHGTLRGIRAIDERIFFDKFIPTPHIIDIGGAHRSRRYPGLNVHCLNPIKTLTDLGKAYSRLRFPARRANNFSFCTCTLQDFVLGICTHCLFPKMTLACVHASYYFKPRALAEASFVLGVPIYVLVHPLFTDSGGYLNESTWTTDDQGIMHFNSGQVNAYHHPKISWMHKNVAFNFRINNQQVLFSWELIHEHKVDGAVITQFYKFVSHVNAPLAIVSRVAGMNLRRSQLKPFVPPLNKNIVLLLAAQKNYVFKTKMIPRLYCRDVRHQTSYRFHGDVHMAMLDYKNFDLADYNGNLPFQEVLVYGNYALVMTGSMQSHFDDDGLDLDLVALMAARAMASDTSLKNPRTLIERNLTTFFRSNKRNVSWVVFYLNPVPISEIVSLIRRASHIPSNNEFYMRLEIFKKFEILNEYVITILLVFLMKLALFHVFWPNYEEEVFFAVLLLFALTINHLIQTRLSLDIVAYFASARWRLHLGMTVILVVFCYYFGMLTSTGVYAIWYLSVLGILFLVWYYDNWRLLFNLLPISVIVGFVHFFERDLPISRQHRKLLVDFEEATHQFYVTSSYTHTYLLVLTLLASFLAYVYRRQNASIWIHNTSLRYPFVFDGPIRPEVEIKDFKPGALDKIKTRPIYQVNTMAPNYKMRFIEPSILNTVNTLLYRHGRLIAQPQLPAIFAFEKFVHEFFIPRLPIAEKEVTRSMWLASGNKRWTTTKKREMLKCDKNSPGSLVSDDKDHHYSFTKSEFPCKALKACDRVIQSSENQAQALAGPAAYTVKKALAAGWHSLDEDAFLWSQPSDDQFYWTAGYSREEKGTLFEKMCEFGLLEPNLAGSDFGSFDSTLYRRYIELEANMYKFILQQFPELGDILFDYAMKNAGEWLARVFDRHTDSAAFLKFIATRRTGDQTTTIGNSLLNLAFVLYCLFMSFLARGSFSYDQLSTMVQKEFQYMVTGDDGGFRAEKHVLDVFDPSHLMALGLKFDFERFPTRSHFEYNNGRYFKVIYKGEQVTYDCYKLGRAITKTCCTYKKHQNPDFYKYLAVAKLTAKINEVGYYPPLQNYFIRERAFYNAQLPKGKSEKFHCNESFYLQTAPDVLKPSVHTNAMICEVYGFGEAELESFSVYLDNLTPPTRYFQHPVVAKLVAADTKTMSPIEQRELQNYTDQAYDANDYFPVLERIQSLM